MMFAFVPITSCFIPMCFRTLAGENYQDSSRWTSPVSIQWMEDPSNHLCTSQTILKHTGKWRPSSQSYHNPARGPKNYTWQFFISFPPNAQITRINAINRRPFRLDKTIAFYNHTVDGSRLIANRYYFIPPAEPEFCAMPFEPPEANAQPDSECGVNGKWALIVSFWAQKPQGVCAYQSSLRLMLTLLSNTWIFHRHGWFCRWWVMEMYHVFSS